MIKISYFKRFMAMCYDFIIVCAVLMLAALIFLLLSNHSSHLSLLSAIVFRVYLVSIIYLYFIYFWLKTGQTIGMLAWGIKLVPINNAKLNLQSVTKRFFFALFFLGPLSFFWAFFTKNNLILYDSLSQTTLTSTKK